jgi:hypothetical protein
MNDTCVRIMTTCTSRKVVVAHRRADPPPAEQLYAGEQHRRLMQGVEALRVKCEVDVWIVSAKWGVIPGRTAVMPYNESFARVGRARVRAAADALDVPRTFRKVASLPAQLLVVLVGNDYFEAARLDESTHWSTTTVALMSPASAARFPPPPRVRVQAIGRAEARDFRLPLTLLKGEVARRLLDRVAEGLEPTMVIDPRFRLLEELHDMPVPAVAC